MTNPVKINSEMGPAPLQSLNMDVLSAYSESFIHNHGPLNSDDLAKAYAIQNAMEDLNKNQSDNVQEFDVIFCEDQRFPCVERRITFDESGQKIPTCKHPSSHVGVDGARIWSSTSGGPFPIFDRDDLELKGQCVRTVWTWGHEGACGSGGIHFPVTVNRWEVKPAAIHKYQSYPHKF